MLAGRQRLDARAALARAYGHVGVPVSTEAEVQTGGVHA
ncbi:hypothetical protein CNE_BB2p02070 (plasmid) [Cupriavidus necator N-1]|uniref:Uncharacterized protein n=1 Tax=Cupriavidus necator (strain ATCC 43291 / DSM 13513 / CCUG 52238 / LMG 8453 / N-1) TaxID=1042878 RepID=F8GYS7_CUPNN|nr:hypothetical protein CNE_BB2p02070 [Cupriavidus necator N-1]